MNITFNPQELTAREALMILELIKDKFVLETYDYQKLETKYVNHISEMGDRIVIYAEENRE